MRCLQIPANAAEFQGAEDGNAVSAFEKPEPGRSAAVCLMILSRAVLSPIGENGTFSNKGPERVTFYALPKVWSVKILRTVAYEIVTTGDFIAFGAG